MAGIVSVVMYDDYVCGKLCYIVEFKCELQMNCMLPQYKPWIVSLRPPQYHKE